MIVLSLLYALPLPAQTKAAEGEYQLHSSQSGKSVAKTVTRWTLYATASGYRLESEFQFPRDRQGRFLQVGELNDKLVPGALGWELHPADQAQPAISAHCKFRHGSIECVLRSEEGTISCKPYLHDGPFWLWGDDLFMLDLPWLIDGAVNMSREAGTNAPISVVTVSDTATDCDFSDEDEGVLELIRMESLEIAGTKVAASHYTFSDHGKPIHLWLAGSGIVLKMSYADGHEFLLANYRQSKNLIPELPLEEIQANPSSHPVK